MIRKPGRELGVVESLIGSGEAVIFVDLEADLIV